MLKGIKTHVNKTAAIEHDSYGKRSMRRSKRDMGIYKKKLCMVRASHWKVKATDKKGESRIGGGFYRFNRQRE